MGSKDKKDKKDKDKDKRDKMKKKIEKRVRSRMVDTKKSIHDSLKDRKKHNK